MSYDEWLEAINILEKSNNYEIIEKMLSVDINNNLRDMISPKLVELIKKKFNHLTANILYEIVDIFKDEYSLDYYLVKLKKDIEFVYKLVDIPQIYDKDKKELKELLNSETKHIYKVLTDEAMSIDPIGQYASIINKNKHRGSDLNELQ